MNSDVSDENKQLILEFYEHLRLRHIFGQVAQGDAVTRTDMLNFRDVLNIQNSTNSNPMHYDVGQFD